MNLTRRGFLAGAVLPVIPSSNRRFDTLIKHGGAWNSCALCLDAGDPGSYVTGNTWADLTANQRDFTRSGPTFTGSPGLFSDQYWAFAGSQHFDGTNDAFFNGLHKDGARWGFMAHMYIPELTGNNVIVGTTSSASNPGVRILANSGEALRLQVGNGSSILTIHSSTERLNTNAWNTVGMIFDENGGAIVSRSLRSNGLLER